jgi:hypothetical protein
MLQRSEVVSIEDERRNLRQGEYTFFVDYEEGNEAKLASFEGATWSVAAGELEAWHLMLSHPSKYSAALGGPQFILSSPSHHVGLPHLCHCLTDCEEDTKQGETIPTTSLGMFSDSFSGAIKVSVCPSCNQGKRIEGALPCRGICYQTLHK